MKTPVTLAEPPPAQEKNALATARLADAAESARAARLRYVSDDGTPGIRRRKSGKRFHIHNAGRQNRP
jgi:DNA topoisomerase IB